MANFDGTVKIDTKIDHGGFLKGFQKMSAQSQKLKNSISETTQQIDKLQQEMHDLQSAPLENNSINKLKSDIDVVENKLYGLYETRGKLEENVAGVFGGVGSNLLPNQEALESLMQQDKEWVKLTSDINKTEDVLTKYEKKLEQANAAEQKKRNSAIDKKAIAIEKATNKLDVYKQKLLEVTDKESGIGKKLDSISNLAKKGFANMTKSGNKSNSMLDKLNGSVSRFTKRIWGVLSSALVFTVLSKAFTSLREKIAATTKQNAQFSASMAVIRGNASSAFNTLITAAMPALNSLMSVIAKATTYLNTFISLLFGKTVKSANAAASATNGQAAALDKAGKAAKKASEYLNAYDEMNVQASENDSSGGGSGGGSDLTYTEDADVESQVSKYLDRIKKAWEKADFTEFGTMLGNKINGVLENIDWSGIQTGATKLGKSLATFLNGFFETPGLFTNIGTTIANALNTAINASLGFAENFHFDSAGKAIADTINGFFKNFDFAKLAETINSWVDGLKTMIGTAIKGISWSTILKDGLDFLTHLDLDTVVISIAAFKWFFGGKELVADALKALMATKVQTGIGSSSIPVSAAIDLAITTAIIGFKVGNWLYENTSFSKFADAVAKWMVDENGDISVGKAITVTLTGLAISVSTAAIAGKVASAVGTALAGGVSLTGVELAITNIALKIATGANFVWSGMTVMAESLTGALGTALSGLASVGNTIYVAIGKACMSATSAVASLSSTIASGISSAVASAGTFLSTNALTVFSGGAASIAAGLFAAIGAAIAGWKIGQLIYDKFSEQIDDIVFKVGDFFTKTIPQALSNAGNAVVDFTVNVKGKIDDKAQEIKTWFANKKDQAKEFVASVKDNASGVIDKIKTKWNEVKGAISDKALEIKASVDDIKQKVIEKWNAVTEWWGEKKLSVKTAVEGIRGKAEEKWNAATEWWGERKLSVSTTVENLKNKLIRSWNTAKTWWSKNVKLSIPKLNFHVEYNNKVTGVKKAIVKALGLSGWPSLKFYANGGFPDMGQLFVARERGAEMVGNIGGKTAVANNDQITSAIASAVGPAVYDAMMSAMANGDRGQINLNLELGGQKITDYVIQDVKNRTFASGGRNPILV